MSHLFTDVIEIVFKQSRLHWSTGKLSIVLAVAAVAIVVACIIRSRFSDTDDTQS